MSKTALYLLAFASFALPAPAAAAHLRLNVDQGPIVEAEINGVPLRLKVELDHGESVSLNPAAAARVGLGRGDGAWTEVIGPVKRRGRFAETALGFAGQKVKASVHWHDGVAAAEADGTISPHLLPFDSVTLERRATAGPWREISFAAKMDEGHGVHVPVRLGRYRLAARFSLQRDRTVAPAAAASVIAAHQGGLLEETSSSEEISAGVRRPVRRLRLERPLAIGELLIRALMARTSDWRGDHLLPATTAPNDREIVVTGAPPSQTALYRITIGLDVLQPCSAATYVRVTGRLIFRCALN